MRGWAATRAEESAAKRKSRPKGGCGQDCFVCAALLPEAKIRENGRARMRMKTKGFALCFQGWPPHGEGSELEIPGGTWGGEGGEEVEGVRGLAGQLRILWLGMGFGGFLQTKSWV